MYFTAIGFSSIGSTPVVPRGRGVCWRACSCSAPPPWALGSVRPSASRDVAARRVTVGALFIALAVWPLAWERLSVVGSHRQFTRDYGLTAFFASPAFYSGLTLLVIIGGAFGWIVYRIDRHTHDSA